MCKVTFLFFQISLKEACVFSIYKKRIESKIGRWPLTCFPAVRITGGAALI